MDLEDRGFVLLISFLGKGEEEVAEEDSSNLRMCLLG